MLIISKQVMFLDPDLNPKTIWEQYKLPITPQIQDTNTVSWGNDDMNAFAAIAASASYNIITQGPNGVGQK
jgi:hypothetical protein